MYTKSVLSTDSSTHIVIIPHHKRTSLAMNAPTYLTRQAQDAYAVPDEL